MTDHHGHGHDHPHPENPFAGQGAVMLDIGGDIGALIVSMPSSMVGVEIDLRPAGAAQDTSRHYPHVAVVDRPVPGGRSIPSLVYGEVQEGSYELTDKGGGPVHLRAEVRGGELTELAWPD